MWLPLGAIGGTAAAGTASIIAASETTGFDPLTLIGSAVTPVVVIVLLLMNKLHTHSEVARLEQDIAALRADNARLRDALTDRVIPALTRSTLVLETLSPLLQTEIHLRAARDRRPEDE